MNIMLSPRKSTLSDFQEVCLLGKGSFGAVSKVLRKQNEQFYVIKRILIKELSNIEQDESINEVKLLSKMDSKYVVRYFDSFIHKKELCIVMEYCDKGDLRNLIQRAKMKNMSCIKEEIIWNIILQVILGLYYLHSQRVLHRDLKSANIFLKKPQNSDSEPKKLLFFDVKIGDLGVSKLLESSTAFAQSIVGTPYYLSPELCSDQPYRDKSDSWALGILVYECCTLHHPFEAKSQFSLIMKILTAKYEPLNKENSTIYMRNMLTWLLEKNPLHRPTMKDLLQEKHVREKLEENDLFLPIELENVLIVTDHLSGLSGVPPTLLSLPLLSSVTSESESLAGGGGGNSLCSGISSKNPIINTLNNTHTTEFECQITASSPLPSATITTTPTSIDTSTTTHTTSTSTTTPSHRNDCNSALLPLTHSHSLSHSLSHTYRRNMKLSNTNQHTIATGISISDGQIKDDTTNIKNNDNNNSNSNTIITFIQKPSFNNKYGGESEGDFQSYSSTSKSSLSLSLYNETVSQFMTSSSSSSSHRQRTSLLSSSVAAGHACLTDTGRLQSSSSSSSSSSCIDYYKQPSPSPLQLPQLQQSVNRNQMTRRNSCIGSSNSYKKNTHLCFTPSPLLPALESLKSLKWNEME